MADQYAHAVKSCLKLKSKGAVVEGIRKKKKKDKPRTDDPEKRMESFGDIQTRKNLPGIPTSNKTPAELKFKEMQEKRQTEKILKKAEKTHKQRVEEFNKHLDSLSEHYDIPKVSWTK